MLSSVFPYNKNAFSLMPVKDVLSLRQLSLSIHSLLHSLVMNSFPLIGPYCSGLFALFPNTKNNHGSGGTFVFFDSQWVYDINSDIIFL